MPYKNNIPQPNDQISVSQSDILGNFAALGTFMNSFSGVNDQGSTPIVGSYTSLTSRGYFVLSTGLQVKYGLADYNPASPHFKIDLDTIGTAYTTATYCVLATMYCPNANISNFGNAIYVADQSDKRNLVLRNDFASPFHKIWFFVVGV